MRMMDITRYELPPEGITLLGYIVRRMHKTEWLAKIPALLAEGENAKALETVAIYSTSASTSFGRAYYQPHFNSVGESVAERDPLTGAWVTANLESSSPHYKISYRAIMPNGDSFTGSEEITGTTVGLRGLGMPAPSRFLFEAGVYKAELTGVLTSELALSLVGNTRIRAYGFLHMQDNAGNTGKIQLDRLGFIKTEIGNSSERFSLFAK